MRRLLPPPPGAPPPRDYLLARIHGRRARLAAGTVTAADPWTALTAEARWFYRQCDGAWRSEFAPLLGLLEGRLLASVLRHAGGGGGDEGRRLLDGSLLAPALIAAAGHGAAATSAALGRYGVVVPPASRAIEAGLTDAWLAYGAARCRSESLVVLLRWLIDRRNLLALSKGLRWSAPQPPPFLAGGTLTPAELDGWWRRRDPAALRRRSGAVEEGVAPAARRALRRAARRPDDPALVVDYLYQVWCRAAGEEP